MADIVRKPPAQSAITYIPPDTIHGQPWWVQPVLTVGVLSLFGIYSIWAAIQGKGFADPYLSPFYSPKLPFGGMAAPFLILWIPLGFRATCYYYRKAYYRSFFWDPPACVRPEPRGGSYGGERVFPWILNNVHRYFLYLSILVLIFLWYDAITSFVDANGHFMIGLGSILMVVNVTLISLYIGSCHSLRHLVGGGNPCFSCVRGGAAKYTMWKGVSVLNPRHPLFAWLSLTSLFVVDVYIRLLIAGVLTDPRLVL